MRPCTSATVSSGSASASAARGLFRGLRVQLIGFLDQRAHPVRLALLPAGVANAHDDFVAAVLGQRHGLAPACGPAAARR